jgi:Asp-tRNA(Asn)/Glu-tRNA(Gln) amidotransferase A subunit family amidase
MVVVFAPSRSWGLSPYGEAEAVWQYWRSSVAGDLMKVNLNLAGLSAVCLPCGFAGHAAGHAQPVGMQLIGRAFGEAGEHIAPCILECVHIPQQCNLP